MCIINKFIIILYFFIYLLHFSQLKLIHINLTTVIDHEEKFSRLG